MKKYLLCILILFISLGTFAQEGLAIYPWPTKIGYRALLEGRIYGNIKIGLLYGINPQSTTRHKTFKTVADASLLYSLKSTQRIYWYTGIGLEVRGKLRVIQYLYREAQAKHKFFDPYPMFINGFEFRMSKRSDFGAIIELNSSFNHLIRIIGGFIFYI